jgi:predicted dehydrogenase
MKCAFGVIGCGNIARFHFGALQKIGARVVHVADLREEAARGWAERLGCRSSTGYEAVMEDEEVTVVSVLSGGASHREICLAALNAGKDVICEKTMTNSGDEAEEVLRTVRATRRLFFTGYMKRFFPAVRRAKELLPGLGRLFSAQLRSYQRWGNFYAGKVPRAFASTVKNYGGAVIKCAGSHLIDLMLYLLGRPESVYASIDYVPGTDFDRKAVALFHYPGGLVASLEAAAHPLAKIGYERNSWDEWIELNGVGGRLSLFTPRWDTPEHNPALLVHYDERSQTVTEHRFDALNPFDVEIAHFAGSLSRRRHGSPDALDGFNVDVVIEAMSASARVQALVPVDYRDL